MRRDLFSVELLDGSTNLPLPEVFDANRDTTFVVASPDRSFKVRTKFDITDTSHLFLVFLEVDGIDVGYHYVLRHGTASAVFQGFRTSENFTRYRSFQFSFPARLQSDIFDASVSIQETLKSAGTIRVKLYAGFECENCVDGGHAKSTIAVPAQVALPEHKKMDKSLTTKAGSEFTVQPPTRPAAGRPAVHKRGDCIQSLELRYQASSWLMLHRCLDPHNPVHAAILAQQGIMLPPPSTSVTSTPSTTTTTTSAISTTATVTSTAAASRPPVQIKQEPLTERAKRPDVADACDLTGDEEVWSRKRIRTKETVTLE
eukprot:TRINITY_DN4932_c0_g1_i1.p1 TRINITY_DN4932_c0_g1~~TRINITY_DN4932_c0_g1_i1.p1  ORF type:complete len:315 (-),score=39.89 TRINITY_DN4932_c0_g1_i1:105-1049(-)